MTFSIVFYLFNEWNFDRLSEVFLAMKSSHLPGSPSRAPLMEANMQAVNPHKNALMLRILKLFSQQESMSFWELNCGLAGWLAGRDGENPEVKAGRVWQSLAENVHPFPHSRLCPSQIWPIWHIYKMNPCLFGQQIRGLYMPSFLENQECLHFGTLIFALPKCILS